MKCVPSKIGRKYGYKRSKHKDFFAVRYARKEPTPLPASEDLSTLFPPVDDQGQLGSCTANAIAGCYCFERMQAGLPFVKPSRLFIYWNERSMEGDTQDDAGAFGGDGILSLEKIGVCDETIWPYIEDQFATTPDVAAFAAAPSNKVLKREIVTTLDEIKGAIADKHGVVFGITLYASFESDTVASSGIVPDPSASEGAIGGHEMCLVGYDDSTQRFKVRNSWGDWGQAGYCTISYNYVMSAASDFEVITSV